MTIRHPHPARTPLSLHAVALLAVLLSGCAAVPGNAPDPRELIRTELYLGLSSPKGDVTDREFQSFLDTSVTPRFPDGYTVIPAEGRWRDPRSERTAREPSRVLVIVRGRTDAEEAKVELIRRDYRDRFDQQSVLRVDQRVTARF